MKKTLTILLIVLFVLPGTLLAQNMEAFDLFENDSVLHVRLTTDLKKMVKGKMKEEYQPAKLEIFRGSETEEYNLQIRSRGNMRKEVCYYPPIKLKFPEEEYSHHSLKWVVTCRNSDIYDQILLKEYVIYKMYEHLTDMSFRTQLLKVEYVDDRGKEKSFTRFAFVLENEDALAERLGGRIYEPRLIKPDIINEKQMALFTFFEYLVANTDWHMPNRHNMETILHPPSESVIVVPYDFDYSGLVHTTYAVPNDDIPVRTVTERYNKGYCLETGITEVTRRYFLEHRDAMIATCEELPYFDKQTRNYVLNFMEDFWQTLENEKAIKNIFARNCQVFEE